MKLLLLFVASVALCPLLLLFLLGGGAPLWVLIPGLVFAAVVGLSTAAAQWMRIISIATLRLLLVLPALILLALCTQALVELGALPWVLWALGCVALFALGVGATQRAPLQPREA